MEELGYVADTRARSLAGGKTNVIGVLVDGMGSAFMTELLRGIDDAISSSGMDMMLCTTNSRVGKEVEYATKLANGMVDGLVVAIPSELSLYLSTLKDRSVPHVLIDIDNEDRDTSMVKVDNRSGARRMTEHLLGLGHRRISMITGNLDVESARERIVGFREAMADAGLVDTDELVVPGDFNRPSGYEAAVELLARPVPPTAIFASSDEMAFGVMRAAAERGMLVPEHLTVVGFDDVPESSWVQPALTTVRQPIQEIGRRAIGLLLDEIRSPGGGAVSLELKTSLVARASSGPPSDVGAMQRHTAPQS